MSNQQGTPEGVEEDFAAEASVLVDDEFAGADPAAEPSPASPSTPQDADADDGDEAGDEQDADDGSEAGDEQDADDGSEAGDGPDAGAKVSRREEALTSEGEIAADYLEELLDIADLDGDIDTFNEGGRAHVSVITDSEILVGRDGEVLEALQELARLAVMTETGHRSRLMLDVAGHREKRRVAVMDLLRNLADRFPQVILITHIESVREGFDRVIRLSYDLEQRTARAILEPRDAAA